MSLMIQILNMYQGLLTTDQKNSNCLPEILPSVSE